MMDFAIPQIRSWRFSFFPSTRIITLNIAAKSFLPLQSTLYIALKFESIFESLSLDTYFEIQALLQSSQNKIFYV